MKTKAYVLYYEALGEVVIPQTEYEDGLTIYSPCLQRYTTEEIQKLATSLGSDDHDDWTHTDALEFLAWWISGDIDEGESELCNIEQ